MSENMDNNATGVTLFSEVLFDIPRHNLITSAAYELLKPNARAKVDQMLGSVNITAGNWGGWADQIKGNNPPNDAETAKFLKDTRNKKHKPWHYVNLPLKSAGYQAAAAGGFTRSDDVVQMYRKCVRVLKNGSTRFSRVNALRLVGHLVGDIHMPLHIGCGFIDDSTVPPTLIFDQQTIAGNNAIRKNSDTGGNRIKLTGAGSMHSFWDGSLSGPLGGINLLAADSTKEKQLVKKIVSGAEKLNAAPANGVVGLAAAVPLEDLAREWADESLKIALQAYQNIVIVSKNGDDYKCKFKTTKEAYIEKFRPVILKQMSRAARRLADLLNAIYP